MWNYVGSLFRPAFWLNLEPVPFLPFFQWLILMGMLILFVGGIWMYQFGYRFAEEKERRKILRSVGMLALWAGVVGGILYSTVVFRIPFLSMRVFWLAWLVGFGWGKMKLVRRWVKDMPLLDAKRRERLVYEKWLPKPRKR